MCHMHCVSVHQGPPGPPGPAGTPAPLAEKVPIMSIFVLSTLRQFIHCLHEDLGVDNGGSVLTSPVLAVMTVWVNVFLMK